MPAIVISHPAGIALFQMKAQLSACRLELRGLRHSSGRSIIRFVKDTFNLKGDKVAVVNQFSEIVSNKEEQYKNILSGAKGAN